MGRRRDPGDDLRHAVEGMLRSPIAYFRRRRQRRIEQVDFWALRNVSLDIKEGEVVGILGANGAGKSTMLRLLSRITVPTEGRIAIEGRIASLLEVGTGFHPELTGRENIFLNGAILGMSRAEIIRKFDEIVAFSEIESFLDMPVKRYSSGMYVRLAFGVAAHLDPDILIVDEVLAVGDTSFQKKCLAKMGAFARSGRTILFVSHNLDAVRTLCQRGIWLKKGHLHRDGPAEQIIDDYFHEMSKENTKSLSNPDYAFSIDKVTLRNVAGEECNQFYPGEELVVDIAYSAARRVVCPMLAVGIVGANGSCFTANMLLDGHTPAFLEGSGNLKCVFKSIPLLPQDYTVKMNVRAATVTDFIIPYQDVAYFAVTGDLADYGYQGAYLAHAKYSTHVVVPYEWQFPDGTTTTVSLHRASSRYLSLAQSEIDR